MCKTKLTMVDKELNCQCNELLCIKHICPHTHDCQFDRRKLHTDILRENNIAIIPVKVQKI